MSNTKRGKLYLLPYKPGVVGPHTGFTSPLTKHGGRFFQFKEPKRDLEGYCLKTKDGKEFPYKDPVDDADGEWLYQTVYNPETRSDEYVEYKLTIRDGGEIEYDKIKDAAIIAQLKDNPHCDGVETWSGEDVSACRTWYKFYDPSAAEEAARIEAERQAEAYDHARNMSDDLMRYYGIYLSQIHGVREVDPSGQEGYLYRRDFEQWASSNADTYLAHIRDRAFEEKMRIAIALHKRVIYRHNERGYLFSTGESELPLGQTRETVITKLSEDSELRNEIDHRVNLEAYKEAKVADETVREDETKALSRKVKELEEELSRAREMNTRTLEGKQAQPATEEPKRGRGRPPKKLTV